MIIIVYRDIFPLFLTCLWYCLSVFVFVYFTYLVTWRACLLVCLGLFECLGLLTIHSAIQDTQVSQVPQARQVTQVGQDTQEIPQGSIP